MSGNSGFVFWSLKDCPIPESLNPGSVCANIKKALERKGSDGAVLIKAYCDKETFSDELFANYRDAGIDLLPDPLEDEFVNILFYLKVRGFNVILASPDNEVASESILRSVGSVWLSTSLLEQGNPDELSNIRITNFDNFNSPQDLEVCFGDGEIED
ncbi:unnamed protein product [Eruca vesicaria subsp. sativa]|uniref:NYN domain-containing protein n=1 Tax=Eruca vesicaria subsp. sativa TaxID=29727 RepID=A0ABC8JTE3_ERUVS|nr:unnamed protein product [Eruca vesicaria subsp. sativa]